MTTKQIFRAYCKLWAKVTEGDGYQPWGYDVVTMRMIHPGFFPARDRLAALYRVAQRKEQP